MRGALCSAAWPLRAGDWSAFRVAGCGRPWPGALQRRCSAFRARPEPHLSVAAGNFRISTFRAEITPGEGPTSELRRRAQPRAPGLARRERRARRVLTLQDCPPDAATDRSLALPGALTSGRKERGRMTRRPLSEAGNSICPRLRSCQGLWATRGNPLLPPAPPAWRGRKTNSGILHAKPY